MARKPATTTHSSIISGIEIAYFRSFYKAQFPNMRPMNVIFGENDTGKSNVMRALNLFFNGRIDPAYDFDFDIDFSSKRLDESKASEGIRKFSYVKIWFKTPSNHKAALGESFYVKKIWSQGSESGFDYSQETSSHIHGPGKLGSLTRFLNKIKFTYIPAIKGRDVYSSLLVSAYEAIAEAAPFSAALDAFTAEIQNQTETLSRRLNTSLKMSSALAPPTDLAELFGSLDFETLVSGGSSMSLTRQRGDGIQARHIPEILAFIAEKDGRPYHIWGLEEPENSLSINSALSMADRLLKIASEGNSQVIITTHSPAFYLIDKPSIAGKYFLKRISDDVEIKDGTNSTRHDLMEFMGDGFYLPLVAERLTEETDKRKEAERLSLELTGRLAESHRAILFVEGETEEHVVPAALARLDPNYGDKLQIVGLGGASHAEALGSLAEDVVSKLSGGRRCFVLLDSDSAGKKAVPKSVDFGEAKNGWQQSATGTHWRVLPSPAETLEAYAAAGVQHPEEMGVCFEDMFSAAIRNDALAANAYDLGVERSFVRTKGHMLQVGEALRHDTHKFNLYEPASNRKMTFARWIVANNRVESDALEQLLGQLLAIVEAEPVAVT